MRSIEYKFGIFFFYKIVSIADLGRNTLGFYALTQCLDVGDKQKKYYGSMLFLNLFIEKKSYFALFSFEVKLWDSPICCGVSTSISQKRNQMFKMNISSNLCKFMDHRGSLYTNFAGKKI